MELKKKEGDRREEREEEKKYCVRLSHPQRPMSDWEWIGSQQETKLVRGQSRRRVRMNKPGWWAMANTPAGRQV